MTSGMTYAVPHGQFFREVPTVDFEVWRDLASKNFSSRVSSLIPYRTSPPLPCLLAVNDPMP